jgi:uncharacterized protein YfiM (DUF2279 family)
MVVKAVVAIFFFIGIVVFAKAQPVDSVPAPAINKKILYSAIVTESAVYLGGMSYLQFVWYKDKELVPFEFYNDSKGYLQIDKCGHSFASYGESYVAYRWLRNAGVSRNKALLYGGTMGIVLQAPIEIFDGMYEGWGFSWSDVVANTAGSALLIGQELLFNEQVVRFKISYSRSDISKKAYGYLGNNALDGFFYDYNSHSFWLSMNANKLFMKDVLPPWLNIAVGYSADGMLGEFNNRSYYDGHKLPQYDRTRQFLLSLDVDWEKIPTHSRFLKTVFSGLNFIKIPFPTLEINSKGKFTPYLIYF